MIFRTANGVGALEDRCPHRGVSLSLGEVRDGTLACAYHGWRFSSDGRCVFVPSAASSEPAPKCRAKSFPCVESQGTIWMSSQVEAPEQVPTWPKWGEPGYQSLEFLNRIECPQLLVLQNFVDCAHTGILHRGLFRRAPAHEIRAKVTVSSNGVVAENFGETNPRSLLARLLVHGDGAIRHVDTYRAPHTVEVNYWWGERHLVTTSLCTPETSTTTRVYTRISVGFGLLNPALILALRPVTNRIFAQDKRILEDQGRQQQRYPDAPRASSVSDLPCLWVEEAHAAATAETPRAVNERTREVTYKL